jgi:hypothetical protein
MNEKTQQQNFDRQLYEKLVKARSETTITEQEAQRLARLFGNYQKRYPLTFGSGVKKIARDWML